MALFVTALGLIFAERTMHSEQESRVISKPKHLCGKTKYMCTVMLVNGQKHS